MSALMFQRLAHSFIKNGYYPTDSETMSRILNALTPTADAMMNIIDPCAGEGTALAECQHHLGADQVNSYAVEYDEERAWHAKSIVDQCIHGDFQDCIVGQRQFGLLFLNPPYGDMVADKANLSETSGRNRLEKLFYQKSNGLLQFGGTMVLVIPQYSLDKELSTWIARHFDRVEAYMAPEKQFKQIVIFGVRRRVTDATNVKKVANKLIAYGDGELPDELPSVWSKKPYVIPAALNTQVKFVHTKLDLKQLEAVLQKNAGIWKHFNMLYEQQVQTAKQPLCKMTDWHLALALAAGQVSGTVKSNDGRLFVIKGDTYKARKSETKVVLEDGETKETITVTDHFVPAIRALDMSPGSKTFGAALIIQ